MDVYSQFGQRCNPRLVTQPKSMPTWSISCHPKAASQEGKPHNSEAFFEDRQGQEKATLKYMQKGLES